MQSPSQADAPVCELAPLPAEQAVSQVAVTRWRAAEAQPAVADVLAEEVPVALVFNGVSHVVMLATPADLEDFAYGFAYTEGIIDHPQQIYGVELHAACQDQQQGIEVHIDLATEQFARLKERRRNLTGRTGCGLCGAESLQQVFRQPQQAGVHAPKLSAAVLYAAVAALHTCQPLQQQTGATHACALVDAQGNILCVREDVGRHNALDKLLGALLRAQRTTQGLLERQWILTTSRASYEMVQKVAMLGGRALVAMSAPTALAADLARTYDMLLVGFARAAQCVVYHGSLQAEPWVEK